MADEKKAPETKSYTLKDGAEITVIENGESKTYRGSGDSTSINLTEDQASAFSDKLEGASDPETANTRNAQTILVGAETAGRATINEGSAAADIDAELGDDNPANTTNTDPVDRPGALLTAGVKSTDAIAPDANASSDEGGTKEPTGGKPAGTSASTANNSSGAKSGTAKP